MRKLFVITVAVGVLCAMLALPALGEEAKKDDVKIPAGQQVFMDAKCNMCHTVYSAGIGEPPTEDAEEAGQQEGPPDLSTAGAERDAEWLSLFLQKKEMLHDKKHMKRFKGSDEDLAALVEWLLTLKPAEEKPEAEATPAAEETREAEDKPEAEVTPEVEEAPEAGETPDADDSSQAGKAAAPAGETGTGKAAGSGRGCGTH